MDSTEDLWRAGMIQGYISRGAGRIAELESTALRGASVHMREILASGASHGTMGYAETVGKVLEGSVSSYSLSVDWLARLAGVCALQNTEPTDTEFATAALQLINHRPRDWPTNRRQLLKLEAELLFEQERFADLEQLFAEHPEVRSFHFDYLVTDSRSPFIRGGDGLSVQRWQERFNRQFDDYDLAPVTLRPGDGIPFNLLTSTPDPDAPRVGEGPADPLVTVIMTAFQPQREDVLQSARSILEQTWQNLELLILDDASPADYAPILDELEALDQRVRVIRLATNGGTYAARNVGIAQARGEYITGQDADDWSHPQRIEKQVSDLLRHPDQPGNQVYTVNMTEDLVRIRRGYLPYIPSAPTLMAPTQLLRELGGYLPARKAADNELRNRLAAYVRKPVGLIKEPLIFMRILPDSLSRADFRPGWQHPARRAFWSAYKTWHTRATPEQLRLSTGEDAPVHVPARFTQPPPPGPRLDVVIAADWCEYGPEQISALEEIHHLLQAGQRVGVLHLDNALHLARYARTHCAPIEKLISTGQVQLVLADEDFHAVGLLLVRNPELLQFMPAGSTAFTPEQVVVAAEAPPRDAESKVKYLPEECARHAEAYFGRRAQWVPSTARVRTALNKLLPAEDISAFSYTSPFAPGAARRRRSLSSRRPVIGRWAGVTREDWPAHASETLARWPAEENTDVRLYGDPAAAQRALNVRHLPANWVAFEPGEASRAGFYRAVDFFVHYAQTPPDHPERAVLEAMASGAVAVLPPAFEPVYGRAALYAQAEDVQPLIRRYSADEQLFAEQAARGLALARRHEWTAYADFIGQLAEQTMTTPDRETLAL
ncbi:glycosyltransferase family 2 protein [Nesterenkonia sp. Act20]|uniref:glycosyltransferase family 2 protein n=1 Tax=Nesterenkonia sp. Act20 TaxID=1483432 RepID=UPI001C47C08D|nr:glycosyltransferase family 2 protein [Nesterenkonia sp. Act20]